LLTDRRAMAEFGDDHPLLDLLTQLIEKTDHED
jgi:hypothetical protein